MQYTKIIFIGTGRVAHECINVLARETVRENILCIGVDKEPFDSTKQVCKELGISYVFVGRQSIRNFLLSITENCLIVSAHNSYLFPESVVKKENLKIVNFHNAFLPFYRGRNAPTWEIYNMEKYAGVTWHEVVTAVDQGGIIVQEKFPILADDTALDVLLKSAKMGIRLFSDNVGKILNGEYEVYFSDIKGQLYLSSLLPNDGYLDVTWGFEKAYAFLRSMDYNMLDILPKPKVKKQDEVYIIEQYRVLPANSEEPAPECFQIFSEDHQRVLYCTLKKY